MGLKLKGLVRFRGKRGWSERLKCNGIFSNVNSLKNFKHTL